MVNQQKKKDFKHLILVIACIILVNIFANYFFTRIDFTKEKRYTISPITENILNSLKKPVLVTVYLEGDFPAGFKRLRNATKDLLIDFKAYAGNNIEFNFIDPVEGKTEEQKQQFFEELYAKGIEPTNLSVKTENGLSQKVIFPGATINYGGKEISVKLLQSRIGLSPDEVLNNSIQNLEYAFISAIKKATAGGKPRIAFTENHGELSDLQLQDALKTLSEGYEAGRVNLSTVTYQGLEKIKLLVIPKPNTAFTEAEKYKIDQFLMRGGKIIWSLDAVTAELDSMQAGRGEQLAFVKELNLDDQLFKYGIRINQDLIGDMNCVQIPVNVGNVAGQGQIQLLPWLFYPLIMPVLSHPMIKNMEGIKTEFVSTIDTIAVKGTKKTVLLSTSPYNRTLKIPTLISLQMVEQQPDPRQFQSVPKAVGVLLEGKFKSVFQNRAIPTKITENFSAVAESGFTKMLVLSDGDIFKNQFSEKDGSVFPLGYDRFTQQTYGNKTFLLNAVDYMLDDSGLISLRNKEITLRLLDKGRIKAEALKWQIINMVLPVIVILIFAIFQHLYRRQKYAS